jgi:transcriptional regulator with XRE-family HTH domain
LQPQAALSVNAIDDGSLAVAEVLKGMDNMQSVMERTAPIRAAKKERQTMHRVGTVKGQIEQPKNLGERLVSRRLELKLSQAQVAEQVTFWNDKKQEWVILSRSAYCMYESGDVVPDLAKVEQIAKALKCAPQWLAFAEGNRSEIEEVDFDPETGEFISKGFWDLNEDWIRATLGVEPSEVVLCQCGDFTQRLKPGDVAIVQGGAEPNSAGGDFAFSEDGKLTMGHVNKNPRGNAYRIYDTEMRTHREVPADSLKFLGKIIGSLGSV